MAITLILKNKKNNKIKIGILGFSWTTLFFGGFVPLIRGDLKMFLILLIFYVAINYNMPLILQNSHLINFRMLSVIWTFNNGWNLLYGFVVHILGAFFYNKIYTQRLVNRGYVPMNEEGITLLKIKGITVHSGDWPQ